MGLLRPCDPRRKLESDVDFIAFRTDVRDTVNSLRSSHPSDLRKALRESNSVGCLLSPPFFPTYVRPRYGSVRYLAPKTGTVPVPTPACIEGVRPTIISTENQEDIFQLLKSSVLPSADSKYELQWVHEGPGVGRPVHEDPDPAGEGWHGQPVHDEQARCREGGQSGISGHGRCRTQRCWTQRSCPQHGLRASPIHRSYASGAAARQRIP
jgi:hypothetical protein